MPFPLGTNRVARPCFTILLDPEHFFQVLPPTLLIRTPFAAFHKALLHPIRHCPPLSNLFVGSHLVHIGLKVRAGVLHRGKQSHAMLVEKDGVVDDIAIFDLLQHFGPDGGMAVLVGL